MKRIVSILLILVLAVSVCACGNKGTKADKSYTIRIYSNSNSTERTTWLIEEAKKVFDQVRIDYDAIFDTTGSIGKRYRREDAIGTPLCVCYDFDSANDGCVTVRERDSMAQERVAIADLNEYIHKFLKKNQVK